MVTVSESHRKLLTEYAERLYQSGINWIPMKYDNSPITFFPKKNMRIVYGPLYMRRMSEQEHNIFKEIVLELPYASGIAVVSRVSGLLMIDFDPAKNSRKYGLEEKIAKVIKDYGTFVYIDRRISQKGSLIPKGLKIGLFIDQSILSSKDIVYTHSYEEEVNDKSPPPKTIYPSLRIDPQTRERSVYIKLSSIDIWEAYYDKDFKLLPEVMSVLGVKVELKPIDEILRAKVATYTNTSTSISSSGKAILGLEPTTKIDTFEKMVTLLKEVAKRIDCPGFLVFLEHLEQGYWIIPYEMVQFGSNKNYQRSSWSIVENHIMRILAEFGVPKGIFVQVFLPKMEGIQIKICTQYQHGCGHKTESRDVNASFSFKEFGHESGGKCIYLRYGICPREDCLNTVYGKLNLLSKSQAYAIRERVTMGLM